MCPVQDRARALRPSGLVHHPMQESGDSSETESHGGEYEMGLKPGNRWWVVLASVVGLLVGNGPIMQFTLGTMMPSITREFGWSRGLVSSAMVAGLWMTGLVTPIAGRLVDRFGIRAVAPIG